MCIEKRRSVPHMTSSGTQNFLSLPQRCRAKPNMTKSKQIQQQQQKGSQIRQNKSIPSLFRLEWHMTQMCSWGTQSPIREVGCGVSQPGPASKKSQPARSPLGYECSWRIYSRLPISPHHMVHLPKSDSALNITQPRKMPLCAFFSVLNFSLA